MGRSAEEIGQTFQTFWGAGGELNGHPTVHGAEALLEGVAQKHGEVAEADEPLGLSAQGVPVDGVDHAYRSVSAPNAPNGLHLRVCYGPVDVGRSGGVVAAKLMVACAQIGCAKGGEALGADPRFGLFYHRSLSKAGNGDQCDAIAGR